MNAKFKLLEEKLLEKDRRILQLEETVLNLGSEMNEFKDSIQTKIKECSQEEHNFKCEKCKFTAKTISAFNEHMREKHWIYECDHCSFTSSSDVGLKIHKKQKSCYKGPTRD